VFLATMFASVLPASSWLRKHPDKVIWPCFLIGLLPYISTWCHLYSGPISWIGWGGYVKGMEICFIDTISIIVLLAFRGRGPRLPFIVPMTLYFIATSIAAVGAQVPEAGFFYVWQLARVLLLYAAVATACAGNLRAVGGVLTGLATAELIEGVVAIWQRFGQHILQSSGTLSSQNELGLASHFVIFPFFALILSGQRGLLPLAVVLLGIIADVMTTSRASVGLGLAGLGAVWLCSSFAHFNSRKLGVAILGLATLAIMAPLAIGSFEKRFANSNLGLAEDTERLAFKRAAWMMLADHPNGVGPNNFSVTANSAGYYSRAGSVSNNGRASNVHNLYLLILTESGPAGLTCYLLMLGAPLLRALRYLLLSGARNLDETRKDVLIGLAVTLAIVYIHSTEEWVPIGATLAYLLMIVFGLIAAITSEPVRVRQTISQRRQDAELLRA